MKRLTRAGTGLLAGCALGAAALAGTNAYAAPGTPETAGDGAATAESEAAPNSRNELADLNAMRSQERAALAAAGAVAKPVSARQVRLAHSDTAELAAGAALTPVSIDFPDKPGFVPGLRDAQGQLRATVIVMPDPAPQEHFNSEILSFASVLDAPKWPAGLTVAATPIQEDHRQFFFLLEDRIVIFTIESGYSPQSEEWALSYAKKLTQQSRAAFFE